MGYSLGGGVALRTAIQHPELVRKLVVVGAPCKRDGWYPEVLAGMANLGPHLAEPFKQSPIYQVYASIAPRPDDWPVLLTKEGDMVRQEYDWSHEVAAITAPTMIVVGDADGVRTAHAKEFFELLGGGKADGGVEVIPWSERQRLAADLSAYAPRSTSTQNPTLWPWHRTLYRSCI